jgi:hypothetical protein
VVAYGAEHANRENGHTSGETRNGRAAVLAPDKRFKTSYDWHGRSIGEQMANMQAVIVDCILCGYLLDLEGSGAHGMHNWVDRRSDSPARI